MSNIMQRQVYCRLILERFATWFWPVASSFKLLYKIHVCIFSAYFYDLQNGRSSLDFFLVVLQFYWQEPSKITTEINKMRHINFSKVTLVMLYMSECFKKRLFFLVFACPVMYFEDSAPETNKTTKFTLGKAVEEEMTTKAINAGVIHVKKALLHCDWIWSRMNTARLIACEVRG